jgi:hypothetical protein
MRESYPPGSMRAKADGGWRMAAATCTTIFLDGSGVERFFSASRHAARSERPCSRLNLFIMNRSALNLPVNSIQKVLDAAREIMSWLAAVFNKFFVANTLSRNYARLR